MMGTNAAVMLPRSSTARAALGLNGSGHERTMEDWFKILCNGWFSSNRSTEAMMRGTNNEENVLPSLRAIPFMEDILEAGLLSRIEAPYLSCSTDGVASPY